MYNSYLDLMDKVDKLNEKINHLRVSRRILLSILEELIEEKSYKINLLREENEQLKIANKKYIEELARKNNMFIKMIGGIKGK